MIPTLFIIIILLFILALLIFSSYFISYEGLNFIVICKILWRDLRLGLLYLRVAFFVRKSYFRNYTIVDYFNDLVRKHPKRICFISEDKEWTYQELDELANQIANYFLSQDYQKGDEVALLLENRPEYVAIWMGLGKIGVVTALINTNLKDASLAHSLNAINAKSIIFGSEFGEVLDSALVQCKHKDEYQMYVFGHSDDDINLSFASKSLIQILENIPKSFDPRKFKTNLKDKIIYIYTSGTTGFPKAAIYKHNRICVAMCSMKYLLRLGDNETFYNSLPLYHSSGGVIFVIVVLGFGGKMVIRKKFSATNFWKDAVKYKPTVSQYIGETCRYLMNRPYEPEETQHNIWLMFGNGLKANIWKEFQTRFKIKKIIEFYGATEGNATLLNTSGKVGAVGWVLRLFFWLYPVYLIKVNSETGEPIRNKKGLCICCKPGEPGQLVGKIVNNPLHAFDGYLNEIDTKKKIITNCFKKGDRAFLSGDILVMDNEGYLYFMDRTGDTYRWHGENVSVMEVEDIISQILGFSSCIVFGVEIPRCEGRAGMAVIECEDNKINMSNFWDKLSHKLPKYAIPIFIRLSPNIDTTGTYKLKKIELKKESYNINIISDPIYVLDSKTKTYIKITKEIYDQIHKGEFVL